MEASSRHRAACRPSILLTDPPPSRPTFLPSGSCFPPPEADGARRQNQGPPVERGRACVSCSCTRDAIIQLQGGLGCQQPIDFKLFCASISTTFFSLPRKAHGHAQRPQAKSCLPPTFMMNPTVAWYKYQFCKTVHMGTVTVIYNVRWDNFT